MFLRFKEDYVYTYGDPMVAEDVVDPGMVVRQAINYTTEVETSYISISLKDYLSLQIVFTVEVLTDLQMIQTLTFLAFLSNILLLDPYSRCIEIMAKMQEHEGKISAKEVQMIN